jgi:chitinase
MRSEDGFFAQHSSPARRSGWQPAERSSRWPRRPPHRRPPRAPRRGVPPPSTPPASRPARTGSITPPTGGPRATTRRPTTAAAARDSRGRPTARVPADRFRGRGDPQAEAVARRTGTGSTSGLLFSPYKDVTINMNWNTYQMQSAVEGSDLPVVGSGSLVSQYIPKLPAITLAFATGSCGSETWGGARVPPGPRRTCPQLNAANLNYVVSTGGEAGTFTCTSTAGMESFIARYASPNLVGIDFDIEGGQSESDIQNLVASAAGAQAQYPNLQFSFTLATLGASDGSYGGVNSLGNEVVEAVLGSSLKNYVINLMTMDFGSASSSVCVVSSGSCEMAQSAIQAVKNLEHTYGIPASKIAVTPMIGLNDNTSETFTTADVTRCRRTRSATAWPGCTSGRWTGTRPARTTTRRPPATPSPARRRWSTPTFLSDLGD